MSRTSLLHPLQIATVETLPGCGRIGVTFCPGKKDSGAMTGGWNRDLGLDLDVIAEWGAAVVVTLVEPSELEALKVPTIGEEVARRHMEWLHLPIRDVSTPGEAFEAAWASAGPALHARLRDGQNVLVHCKGGLGRAGTIAARLLVELGTAPLEAIARVRAVRPGALETKAQEAYVAQHAPFAAPTPLTTPDALEDRAIGALIGLAVGDAVGTTLEFKARNDKAERHTKMIGGGPFHLKAGEWTDDTAMALALTDSLTTDPALDTHDLMRRFVQWWQEGFYSCTGECFDIGNTTRQSLQKWLKTGNPLAGSTEPQTAGNGSLMRLAPVAIRHWRDAKARSAVAAQQSRTTHGAPEAVDACILYADMIAEAIAGRPRAEILAPRPCDGAPKIAALATGAWRNKPRKAIKGSGYVVDALEASLWCIARTADFRSAVLMAANLRDDADTTAAITGQLAGALYGASSIPERWRDTLAWRPRIATMANGLFEASLAVEPDNQTELMAVLAAPNWLQRATMQISPRQVSLKPLEDPSERRALRVLQMVHELHKAGFQRLRISPGIAPSGCYWRCPITYAGNIEANGWEIIKFDFEGGRVAPYSSADGNRYFGIPGAESMNARQLAAAFLEHYGDLKHLGQGRDWAYAGWLTDVIGQAEQGGRDAMLAFYSDGGDHAETLRNWEPPPPPAQ